MRQISGYMVHLHAIASYMYMHGYIMYIKVRAILQPLSKVQTCIYIKVREPHTKVQAALSPIVNNWYTDNQWNACTLCQEGRRKGGFKHVQEHIILTNILLVVMLQAIGNSQSAMCQFDLITSSYMYMYTVCICTCN